MPKEPTDYDELVADNKRLRLNARDLIASRERCRKALAFYADLTRYDGPNQRLPDGESDPYTPANMGYRMDVIRDLGKIARDALERIDEKQEPKGG